MYRDDQFQRHRFWQIKSVCRGGQGQEGLVELESLPETPGDDTDEHTHVTTWVPECLLRGRLYTPSLDSIST